MSGEELTYADAAAVLHQLADDPPAALLLDRNGLTALPDAVGDLSALRQLSLNDNALVMLPAAIGSLTRLQALELSGNRLTRLPDAIGWLAALASLRLGGNCLETLPPSIGGLRALRALGLNGNRLAALPTEIGHLTSLTSLRLHANRLASLPASMGTLASLTSLAAGANRLTSLPVELCALHALEVLGLNANALTALPAGIGALTSLRALGLEGNRLARLPAEIGQLRRLVSLALSGNQLAELPSEIGDLGALESLSLGGNALAALPTSLCKMGALRTLWLTANRLRELPTAGWQEGLGRLETVAVLGNPLRHIAGPFQCRTLWMDDGVTIGADVTIARRIVGTADPSLPYLNFMQRAPSRGARTLIVAFGVAGFEFGGVLNRAGAPVDVLLLYDERHTAYLRDADALRAFLSKARGSYARVGTLGSSQGAFGALHYLDCVDAVLAISPLDNMLRPAQIAADASTWLPVPRVGAGGTASSARPCHVTVHVSADNFLDVRYAQFCAEAHRAHPEGWAVRIVEHAGARHPAYPGDAAVHAWVHALVGEARAADPSSDCAGAATLDAMADARTPARAEAQGALLPFVS